MISVQRKEKETSESLIRRFSRRVQQSRVLAHVRKNRFRVEEKTKTQRRHDALYKLRITKEIDKLKKFGNFDDDALRELKKRIKQDR